MNDGTLKFDTKIDNSGFSNGLKDLENKSRNTSNTMNNGFKENNQNLLNLKNSAKLVGTVFTGKLVKDTLAMGIDFNNQIESFTGNFSVLLGSQEEAVKKVNELKVMAQKTPFGMADLADATKTLLAFEVPANETQDILKRLGDISLGNKEKLKGLALVFGQVSSAGRLTGQDLMQFINQGFNPLNNIAKRTGESMQDLRKRMSEGGVGVDEVKQALIDATSEGGKFYNGMAVGAETAEGKMSTLKDTFAEFVANKLKPFNDFASASLIPTLIYVLENFEKFKPVLVLVGIAIGTLTALYVAYNIQQVLMTKNLTLWNAVALVGKNVTGALGSAFAFLTSPIGLVILAIGAVIAIAYLLIFRWEETLAVFKKFDAWLTNIFTTDWSKSFGMVGHIMNGFVVTVKSIWDSIKQIFNGVVEFVKGAFAGNWKQAWQGVVDAFGGIMSGLTSVIKAPLNGVISLVNGAIGALNGISVSIPKWVPKFGGRTFGVSIPSIPYLEKGGILKKGQRGFLEGNGAEAVVPLERNKYWIGAVAKEMMKYQPLATNETNNQTINFYQPVKTADEVARTLRLERMYRLGGA